MPTVQNQQQAPTPSADVFNHPPARFRTPGVSAGQGTGMTVCRCLLAAAYSADMIKTSQGKLVGPADAIGTILMAMLNLDFWSLAHAEGIWPKAKHVEEEGHLVCDQRSHDFEGVGSVTKTVCIVQRDTATALYS